VRALVALGLVAVALGGCGGGGRKPAASGLSWDGQPQVFSLKDLPSDRVLIGQVVNNTSKTIHLNSGALSVHDASGHTLKSSGAYTATFGHGLYGAFQQPSKIPQPEAARLGHDIYLIPKDKSPFFSAWRIPPGSRGPFTIQYGAGPPLAVPTRVKPATG
jgi:hypothetical protein